MYSAGFETEASWCFGGRWAASCYMLVGREAAAGVPERDESETDRRELGVDRNQPPAPAEAITTTRAIAQRCLQEGTVYLHRCGFDRAPAAVVCELEIARVDALGISDEVP